MNKQIVIDRVEAASVILDFLTKDSACHAAEGDTQQGGRGALTEAGSHGHAAPLLPLFLEVPGRLRKPQSLLSLSPRREGYTHPGWAHGPRRCWSHGLLRTPLMMVLGLLSSLG